MRYGTTYIVRPLIAPSQSPWSFAYIAFGRAQLFVGPASSRVAVQMKVHCSDARDVVGIGAMEIAARQFFLVQFDEDSGLDRGASERFLFRLGTIAPEDAIGTAQRRLFLHPLDDVLVRQLANAQFISHTSRIVPPLPLFLPELVNK